MIVEMGLRTMTAASNENDDDNEKDGEWHCIVEAILLLLYFKDEVDRTDSYWRSLLAVLTHD